MEKKEKSMRYCPKCGTQNPEQAKFCRNCGTKLVRPQEDLQPAAPKPPRKHHILPFAILGGIVFALALAFVIIKLLSPGDVNIDLNQYVKAEEAGYNGYGSCSLYLDWNRLVSDRAGELELTSKGEKAGYTNAISVLEDLASLSIDGGTKENCSNGDVIYYSFSVDTEQISQLTNCKLTCADGSYTISNLGEVAGFDPFDDLEVTFSGIEGSGQLALSYNGDYFSTDSFHPDHSSSLSNGDTVRIYLEDYEEADLVTAIGKLPTTDHRDYTVSGLKEIGSFNPFNSLKVTFSGTDGSGKVTFSYSGDYFTSSSFVADKGSGLSNGDTVRVYLADYDENAMISAIGMLPTTEHMDYTVSGLSAKTTSSSSSSSSGSSTSIKKDSRGYLIPSSSSTPYKGFVFPDSHIRKLKESEIEGMSKSQSQKAINELYARYGGYFATNASETARFEKYDWYEPCFQANQIEESEVFNSIEYYNMELLADYQEGKGYR